MAESVRAEEENIRLANHMRLLLESTGEGIYGIDLNGRCTFINSSAASMIGYEVHEASGRNMHELIHHSHPDGSPYLEGECPVLGAFRLGRGCRLTTEVLWRKDGSCFAAEISSHPIFEDGSITGAVVTFSDITEKKGLEAELFRAEQLSLIGELAASLAHEIKNPLAGIQGAVDILIRRRDAGDPEREVLESVRNEVRRVDETMRALLDLSRPRALSVASRSLTAVVEKAVSLARDHVVRSNVARGRRIRLIFQTCDEPLVIPLDADQMEDAVLNLLLNAIDAIGDEGAVTVSVIRKEDPATGRSEGIIKVEDSGRGIAREDLDKIFSPFFSTTPGGTGLGLPAVRRIMRAHGGRVGVQSTLGKGSIFTLHLPVPKSEH